MSSKGRSLADLSMSKRGFTLVEILVTMCIFSIVTVGLVGCLLSGLKLWRQSSSGSGSHNLALLELEDLFQNLRHTVYLPGGNLTGTDSRLGFTGADSGRLIRFVYEFDPDNKNLTVTGAGFADRQAPSARVLFAADAVKFSYFVLDQQAKIYSWQNMLTDRDALVAVKAEFDLDGSIVEKTVIIPQGK